MSIKPSSADPTSIIKGSAMILRRILSHKSLKRLWWYFSLCSFLTSRCSRPTSIKTLLPQRSIRLLSGSFIKSRLLLYESTPKYLHFLVMKALFVYSSIPLYSLLLSAALTRYPYSSHCPPWPPSNPHLDRLSSKDPIINQQSTPQSVKFQLIHQQVLKASRSLLILLSFLSSSPVFMSRFQRFPFSSRSVAPGHSSSTSASLFETGLGYQSHTSSSLLPQPSGPSMFSHYNTTTENQRRAAGKKYSILILSLHQFDASTRVCARFHQPSTIGLQHSDLSGAHQTHCRYLTVATYRHSTIPHFI